MPAGRRCGRCTWAIPAPIGGAIAIGTDAPCREPKACQKADGLHTTGVVPANSYRALLDANGAIVWETVRDGKRERYQDEPETGLRRESPPTC
jgi:hypothetical protein